MTMARVVLPVPGGPLEDDGNQIAIAWRRGGRPGWLGGGACRGRGISANCVGLLTDEIVEGTGAHAGGEGGFAAHAVFEGVGEEVHGLHYNARRAV
jgi:hypothetical protein